MTKDKFVDRFADAMVGIIERYLAQEGDSAGDRKLSLRAVVRKIEGVCGQMYDVMNAETARKQERPTNNVAR